jgi:aspartyl protease family protein
MTRSSRHRPGSRDFFALALAVLLAFSTVPSLAAPHVEVEGLMPPNAAVLNIDGERKLLKINQTYRDITLIAVRGQTATLDIEGKQALVGLSTRVGANYQPVVEKSLDIPRNQNLQYRTTAHINGRKTEVLVDTGANIVALNASEAARLGVNVAGAQPVVLETASEKVNGWQVRLRSVDVGGMRVDSVEAVVIDGGFPATILLGMSYLKHVKIKENQGIMTLYRAY